jgi:hypothetical protein
MQSAPDERRALQQTSELERTLAAVEMQLGALAQALARPDADAVDRSAADLHVALAAAIEHFTRAARLGGVPLPLRQRLALAGGQVAAQREALARATASLDRAMDVLLPRQTPAGLYSAFGATERPSGQGGSLLA